MTTPMQPGRETQAVQPMESDADPETRFEIPSYSMNSKFRGHAVIIVNEKFEGLPNRSGAKFDLDKMEALFIALDFQVWRLPNLKAWQMKSAIEQAIKMSSDGNPDCFALVLSTHGYEEHVTEASAHMHFPSKAAVWRHAVLGVDMKTLFVDDILDMFDCSSNPENPLNGKPKLFFIQACRSGHLAYREGQLASFDTGVEVKVSLSGKRLSNIQPSDAEQHDDNFAKTVNKLYSTTISQETRTEIDSVLQGIGASHASGSVEIDPTPVPMEVGDHPTQVSARPAQRSTFDIVALSCPDDCLIMYPVMSGKFAFRQNNIGSFMLHYMYQEMNRKLLLEGCDILEYLTTVNKAMAATEIYYEPTDANKDPVEMMLRKENMPFKMVACIVHRLTKSLKFKPKPENSVMEQLKGLKIY